MATIDIPANRSIFLVNVSSAAKTFRLPAVSSFPGRMIIFKDIFGAAQNSSIFLSTTGTDIIERSTATTTRLSTSYGAWTYLNDGARTWFLADMYANTMLVSTIYTAPPYNNFLWTRFYNITSDPSINGPGSSGWGALIGTSGAYNPINFQDGDSRINQSDFVGVVSKGFMYSATTTVVTFRTNSDDGIVVYFNGVAVLQNWTYHGDTINDSASVTLPAGYTPIELRFFEWGGGFTCELYWSVGSTGTYVSDGTARMFHNDTSKS